MNTINKTVTHEGKMLKQCVAGRPYLELNIPLRLLVLLRLLRFLPSLENSVIESIMLLCLM